MCDGVNSDTYTKYKFSYFCMQLKIAVKFPAT